MNINKIKAVNINIKHEREIKCLLVVMLLKYCSLYLFDVLDYIPTLFWTNAVNVLMILCFFALEYLAYKKWGTYREKNITIKNIRQYIWAFFLLLVLFAWYYLYVVRGSYYKWYYVGASDGFLFSRLSLKWFIYYLFIFLVVAFTEEFFYRIFVQGNLTVVLGKLTFLAPFISALYFGVCHHVQGSAQQVVVTFGFGLIIGYAKQYLKNCTFISVVLAHWMYDFILTAYNFL